MSDIKQRVEKDVNLVVDEWLESDYLSPGDVFVVGCSTSEVIGEQIGTSGSEDIAEVLFKALKRLEQEADVQLAFQGCEHINRALVVERSTMEEKGFERVSVVPHRDAGGSMTAYAYKHFLDAVVVEDVEAAAGIDIGDTMIGMHLKKVAVPLRFKQKTIGSARLTGARTRPKLIGGVRAKYE